MTSPIGKAPLLNRRDGKPHAQPQTLEVSRGILPEQLFSRTLFVERKRSERSGRGFVLMLLESSRLLNAASGHHALEDVLSALARSTRDTDIQGWYKEGSTIGVIFTEVGTNVDGRSVASALLTKVAKALSDSLSINQINEIKLSFRVFPEHWDHGSPVEEMEAAFYDSLTHESAPGSLPRIVKRSMDIVGSLAALLVGLPLFLGVALAVKLTSRGPALFRQQRIGQYGRKFNFLKFRSMYVNNDQAIHQEYTRHFITNSNGSNQTPSRTVLYKLAADPRITPIGRFLRRSSLDEIPQFINVLMGDMSLVGPRPPVPYEVECYREWHKTRLLAVKPGITGLWQVEGRSRVKFDEMVRMDLRYARSWSIWQDIKILLQTPLAVFSADGAH